MKLSPVIIASLSSLGSAQDDSCNPWIEDCRDPPREPFGGGTGAYDQFGKNYMWLQESVKTYSPEIFYNKKFLSL